MTRGWLPMGAILMLGVAFPWASACSAEPADGKGWISLFDGKSLDGWMVRCRPADADKVFWTVEDGAITGRTTEDDGHHYVWLLTQQEFDDFELELKVQTFEDTTGNSGVQVRSRYDDTEYWLDGPQVDINPPGPWRSGFIYDETREAKIWVWPDVGKPANAKPEHAPEGTKWFHAGDGDAWNTIRIICRGTHIATVVNGVTIADYDGSGHLDDENHRRHNVGMKGHIGLQIHPGKLLHIRFKDIRVRPL